MCWERRSFKTIAVSETIELKTSRDLLSEAHAFYVSECSVEVPSNSCMQQTEGTQITSPLANSVSESPLSRCCEEKEQHQGECQSSDRCNYPKSQCPPL